MSRVEKFKRKKWLPALTRIPDEAGPSSGIPLPGASPADGDLPSKEKLNHWYTILTVLITAGLWLAMKFLRRLEQDPHLDSQFALFLSWNRVVYFAEAMVLSSFLPAAHFILRYMLYFLPSSRITLCHLERAYGRAVIYPLFCLLVWAVLLPFAAFQYAQDRQTAEFYLLSALAAGFLLLALPFAVRRFVTKDVALLKGYPIFAAAALLAWFGLANQASYYDAFPSLRMEKELYYSASDKTAIATFKGTNVVAYLCKKDLCRDKTQIAQGILLNRYRGASQTRIIVDLTDPRITSGSYEVRVFYRTGESGPANADLHRLSVARTFQYIFNGETKEQRNQYWNKYYIRMKAGMTVEEWNRPELQEALSRFTARFEALNFYMNEELAGNEFAQVKKLLPDPAREILEEFQYDLVFHLI